ncbi:MAG: hypothetical protein VX899_16435 [Myxococcota bacterium]|nr:hypothetical protein [Myxococcota bacterium]
MPELTELWPILRSPTFTSTAGYPYLQEPAFVRLRDWVPLLFSDGATLLGDLDCALEQDASVQQAVRVVRQVVNTAAVTAPPDLWLLRQVLDTLRQRGTLQALATACVKPDRELAIDLSFLLSRGYLTRQGDSFRLAEHSHAQGLLELPELPALGDLVPVWRAHLRGEGPAPEHGPLLPQAREPGLWFATAHEIQLGFRLVPLVLAVHAEGLQEQPLTPQAEALLAQCGLSGGPLRQRVLRRGPGPFGIIQAYHPYMAQLSQILDGGRGSVHVERSANVAASQVANRKSFERMSAALDRFCQDTGHRYGVHIEHALGRGEATRQRWEAGPEGLVFVGADLEDASLDAARAQQAQGHLPADMRFVQADIGNPQQLLAPLADLDLEGAVMVVGNGFHEVRGAGDSLLIAAMKAYQEAGLILLFTEESALAVDDLLHTAFNTYHAGFKYVHERSGQGLRPATPVPPSALAMPLSASWTECAEQAGYRRVERYCVRSRTIYPYTPAGGHNPAISVNHFFVPERIARELAL